MVEYSGLVFDIIKELAKNLNFTYTVDVLKLENHRAGTNLTGKDTSMEASFILTNAIPDVVVNMIKTKSVAMAACGLTITENEKMDMNFTSAISTMTYTFLVSRPKELSRALLFMSPFSKDVRPKTKSL